MDDDNAIDENMTLTLFSMQTIRDGGACGICGLIADISWAAVKIPRGA
jgi:hypothetical protein